MAIMHNELTVAAASASVVFHTLLDTGVAQEAIEARSGISRSELELPDNRICISDFHRLWDAALELSNDPGFGLEVGAEVNSHRMGVVAHAVFNNPTLERALEQYVRLFRLINEGESARLVVNDDTAVLEFHCEDTSLYCVPDMERTLAAALSRTRRFVRADIDPAWVSFQHAEPDYTDKYQALFRAPVNFDAPCCAMAFDSALLKEPLPDRNPYLYEVLSHHAENLLSKLRPKPNILKQLRRFISEHLSREDLDADSAAQHLNMSRHTLYRKLKREGVSFQSLVDDMRHEQALVLLEKPNLSVSEVAFLLGFSELSAFSRAFKRRTGSSPVRYRQQLAAK